jgi:hypothetical protein
MILSTGSAIRGQVASRKASRIKLSADERAVLDRRVRRRKIARADAQRAEIILRAA